VPLRGRGASPQRGGGQSPLRGGWPSPARGQFTRGRTKPGTSQPVHRWRIVHNPPMPVGRGKAPFFRGKRSRSR
jgi:hypothetical protein